MNDINRLKNFDDNAFLIKYWSWSARQKVKNK